MRFGERLLAAIGRFGPLCVGIDAHPGLLAQWGLPDDAGGLRRFALTVTEALGGQVAALKPQSAFFERHGAAGVAVLEEVLGAATQGGTQVIVDAKRGDIGSTMAGYADAYLAGGPLSGDALTVSPYLGPDSLSGTFEVARANERGVFVLTLTSNPEGVPVQHARTPNGEPVAVAVARAVARANRTEPGLLGSMGLVVGATVGSAVRDLGLDLAAVRGPLLAPGVGAQGAGAAELTEVFGTLPGVLAATSRAVLAAGPDLGALRAAAARAVDLAAGALG